MAAPHPPAPSPAGAALLALSVAEGSEVEGRRGAEVPLGVGEGYRERAFPVAQLIETSYISSPVNGKRQAGKMPALLEFLDLTGVGASRSLDF
ncbi:hypothetical protein PJF56_15805 [Roseofilum sp. BLCC_M91]|uniref:Uncharacterized protein n=1 Tax=Roseofilum halophilum BLCC-M91 TaxID=3022259 RepID=A0ABT7BMB3_9CYAN|nr:hypothetical protein [Roseofilum halophilum]MDJ1180329.1 hypothetical protein [Roseofilum halophilum BLCC-M91]